MSELARARAERDAYRVIIAEVIARLEEALQWSGSPEDDAQIAEWSIRAGLGNPRSGRLRAHQRMVLIARANGHEWHTLYPC